MAENYYRLGYCSNSNLTQLYEMIACKAVYDPTEAYLLGSLVDALITEPDKISFVRKELDGHPIEPKMWNLAIKMEKAFRSDTRAMQLIKNCEFQRVSIVDRKFDWNGFEFNMMCKCKWDFFGPNISGDIKTTAAKTQQEFEYMCGHFQYWRSRAWYMDLENTNRDVLIGISKVNFKLFYVVINRGDERYELGRQQYLDLAMKYYVLIYNQNNQA